MNRRWLAILLTLFPILALADDGSLSFTPPPGDYSMIFLGDIFGIVDGILHGSGSQIMGNMFGVFNAAVLALGGIIIMYTLIVSTMNTAHEGQMLGQKWSSIYIPVRSTIGLALLIPKASGYCLMQIFVMWVVVQGVGAADKVWAAALSYLNRGGVIIQGQIDPSKLLNKSDKGGVAYGAQMILAGQVCMLSLEKQLQSQLQAYMTQKQAKSGPCSGTPSTDMAAFCNSSVPSFINSVNIVQIQNTYPTQSSFKLSMPNFDPNSVYSKLNGICGYITWSAISADSLTKVKSIGSITDNDLQTIKLSRAIAIQQMYLDLTTLAQTIVGNDPAFQKPGTNSDVQNFSPMAIEQFGVPHSALGPVCPDSATSNCVTWGPASGSTSAVLFNGNEFQNAITDYNGIMIPTLTLINQANDMSSANNSREFISEANVSGWIMAGSYFFNLINLNVVASSNDASDLTDSNTGLDSSSFVVDAVTSAFSGNSQNAQCTGTYAILCTWLNQDVSKVSPIPALINGTGSNISPIPLPNLTPGQVHTTYDGEASSTVYGYTNNASVLRMPGQPGTQKLAFANLVNIKPDTTALTLPPVSFDCGWAGFICLGRLFGDLFYNVIFRFIYNSFMEMFGNIINNLIIAFLVTPIQGMSFIFTQGLTIISTPGVNPVVALANMGTYFINFSAAVWLMMIDMSITASLIPVFGPFIFALISLAMPIVLAWLGTMIGIGFITAYYVPILPYMIFTFGAVAWLMAVIEAMVAAPIVALGVTHPEGHDAFGKGESAVLILLNVFLRPSMMIIGYIAAIALSYVSVWIINAGFDNAIGFMQGSSAFNTLGNNAPINWSSLFSPSTNNVSTPAGNIQGGYIGWAGVFAFFFSALIYTTMYVTVVQKAFTLIAVLPDKVLRWIGGQGESFGTEAAQWAEKGEKAVEAAGKETSEKLGQMDKQLKGYAGKLKKQLGGKGSDVSGKGGKKNNSGGPEAGAAPE